MENDEIRLAIAKLKGWIWYKLENTKCDFCGRGSGFTRYHLAKGADITIGTSWKKCEPPESIKAVVAEMEFSMVPNWPADIAAAWELVEEFPHYSIKKLGGDNRVEVILFPENILGGKIARADTPARAICLAYLAWKQANP